MNWCEILLFALLYIQCNASDDFRNQLRRYKEVISNGIERSLTYQMQYNAKEYMPANNSVIHNAGHFDYVIVGSGASGAVIASRLSEITKLKVLLIEAGDYENDFTDIPSMAQYSQRMKYNWNYYTTPQSTGCFGSQNQRCNYLNGKAVGGSTVINAALYTRGNRIDYDNWAAQGNPGWSYRQLLPYFQKSERTNISGDLGYHGKDGPLNVEYLEPPSPFYEAFVDANLELGSNFLDYNGENQLGVGRAQQNNLKGKRQSTATAFLKPAKNRKNLKIFSNAYATKILISKKTKTAAGVLFSNSSGLYKVMARREVIISAGAIGSPKLLMQSGIGPKEHLNRLKIPVIQNLPVGENLHDHVAFGELMFKTNYTEPTDSLDKQMEKFFNGTGPLSHNYNVQGLAYIQTSSINSTSQPDLELMLRPLSSFKINAYSDIEDPGSIFLISPILLHPISRGTLTLKSADPYEYPEIDVNLLSDRENRDIRTLYAGIQKALELAETNAFRKLNATLIPVNAPACNGYNYMSESYWRCVIRYHAQLSLHVAGTCKMGPDPKTGAVVDHQLRVHGINHLRVADASVIPNTLSGHTAAVCIMIGEVLADIIKNSEIDM